MSFACIYLFEVYLFFK